MQPLARLCLFITLSAFLAQSYVVQNHFHPWPSGTGHSVLHVVGGAPAPGKLPFHKSPLKCPLCQAHAAAGAVFVPSMPVLPAPVLQEKSPVRHPASVHISTSRHHYGQSRAPPFMPII